VIRGPYVCKCIQCEAFHPRRCTNPVQEKHSLCLGCSTCRAFHQHDSLDPNLLPVELSERSLDSHLLPRLALFVVVTLQLAPGFPLSQASPRRATCVELADWLALSNFDLKKNRVHKQWCLQGQLLAHLDSSLRHLLCSFELDEASNTTLSRCSCTKHCRCECACHQGYLFHGCYLLEEEMGFGRRERDCPTGWPRCWAWRHGVSCSAGPVARSAFAKGRMEARKKLLSSQPRSRLTLTPGPGAAA